MINCICIWLSRNVWKLVYNYNTHFNISLCAAASTATTEYSKIHVSFQSTPSCNIQGVNSLNKVKQFTTAKTRGMGANKR